MKKYYVLIMFLILLIPSTVYASESNQNSCQIFEKGQKTILKDELTNFENDLKNKVNYLNKEENNFTNSLTYSYEISNIKYTEEKKETLNETVKVEKEFATQEEAENYYNALLPEKSHVFKNPIFDKEVIVLTSTGDKKEIDCNSLNCQEEIDKIQMSLKGEEKFVKIEIIQSQQPITTEEKVEYKQNNKTVYFNTKEEAENFEKNYRPSIAGLTFTKNEVISEIISNTVNKTYDELIGNNYFTSENMAQQALREFQNTYNTENGTIEKFRDTSKEENIIGKESFDTQEEAERWIKDNTPNALVGEMSSTISNEIEKIDEESISKSFSTHEELESYIKEIENQGYQTEKLKEDMKIEYTSEAEKGEINHSEKNEDDVSEYLVNSENDFIIIKQSHWYVVWTKEELTSYEKERLKVNLSELGIDHSLDNQDLIGFYYGYGEFNIEGNSYIISLKNNDISVMAESKDNISHITYGTFKSTQKEQVKYLLEGLIYREKVKYVVSYNKLNYVYAYKINASAQVNEQVEKYKIISYFNKNSFEQVERLVYRIDSETTKEVIKLRYDDYLIETYELVTLNWQINKCEKNIESVNNEEEINPPKTSVKITDAKKTKYIILLILGLIMVLNWKHIFKKEN